MKVDGTIARMALAGAVRSIEPVELSKPLNWFEELKQRVPLK
jgi:hypothetical protein